MPGASSLSSPPPPGSTCPTLMGQLRAAVRSKGTLRGPNAPARAHAAQWSFKASRAPRQEHTDSEAGLALRSPCASKRHRTYPELPRSRRCCLLVSRLAGGSRKGLPLCACSRARQVASSPRTAACRRTWGERLARRCQVGQRAAELPSQSSGPAACLRRAKAVMAA